MQVNGRFTLVVTLTLPFSAKLFIAYLKSTPCDSQIERSDTSRSKNQIHIHHHAAGKETGAKHSAF